MMGLGLALRFKLKSENKFPSVRENKASPCELSVHSCSDADYLSFLQAFWGNKQERK